MNKLEEVKKTFKSYKELSLDELYSLVKLRIDVFVVEQDCPYSDLDNKDQNAIHYLYQNPSGEVIAYLRILDKGVSYQEVAIGRVIVHEAYRSLKCGHSLMAEAIGYIEETMNEKEIRISAQKHLTGYYGRHGFEQVGEEYLEDGIPHVQMFYKKKA